MFYNNLIINKKNWDWLSRSYINNQLPHAMLFHGDKGIGKEGHAIEFAALLNCSNKLANSACGNCSDCTKVKTLQHPNINIIIPYPRRNSISKNDHPDKLLNTQDIDLFIKQKKIKGVNPYSNLSLKGSNSIPISAIRNIKKELYNTSHFNGYTVILIFEAEKLCTPTPSSGNALLKILEEPPEKTLFILISNQYSQIIDTIKSRCQKYYFPNLNHQEIISYFNNINIELEEEKLKLFTYITNGNINFINNLIDSSKNILKEAESLLSTISSNKMQKWTDFILKITINTKDNFDNWNYKLKFIIILFRDILLVEKKIDESLLTFPKLYKNYTRIISNFPHAHWSKCIDIVEETILSINKNGYLPLMLITMGINIQSKINKK